MGIIEKAKEFSLYKRIDYFDLKLEEYMNFKNRAEFSELDKAETYDITYSRNCGWNSILQGLKAKLKLQTRKIKEQKKLRANCKSYNIYYRKDGKLLQVENYLNGKLEYIYKVYYSDNKRYIISFYASSKSKLGYSYVAEFKDEKIIEECMFTSGQLVYMEYDYNGDKTHYCEVNYVPNGAEFKLLSIDIGYYTVDDKIVYTETYHKYWFEELRK